MADEEMMDADQALPGDASARQRPRRHTRGTGTPPAAPEDDPEALLRRARRARRAGRSITSAGAAWVGAALGAQVPAADLVDDPMDLDAPPGEDAPLAQVLDAWAAADGQGEGEDRREAVERIEEWIEAGDASAILDLAELQLTELPARLPSDLLALDVQGNQLSTLIGAPAGLQELFADHNQLTSFAGVPAGLQILNVNFNRLESLEGAPADLMELHADENQLTNLVGVPAGLRELHINGNQLESLAGAPATLEELFVNANRLTNLDDAPAGLRELFANDNRFTSLVGAPTGLKLLSVADNRLRSLDGAPPELNELRADRNQLTSLSGAQVGLQKLYVDHNQLTSLAGAPAGLRELRADHNQLTSLAGAPAGLNELRADHNQLANLAGAPAGLELLSINYNQVTSLAEAPAGLAQLLAGYNQLTSLPEDLLTRLSPDGDVFLEGNPLPEQVRTNLEAATTAEDYEGPYVHFSMAGGEAQEPARPLHEAAADWLGDDPEAAAAWQGFAEEPGAAEYSRFLDRLRGTVSYGNADFRQAIVADLRQAAARPRLREKYFLLAFGATETCEDRVTLTWNGMQTARLADDAQDGAYDEKLDELVPQARRLFRLDALDPIARAKVKTLRFVDEIEVYLAYQVKLRERLDLQLVAPDMRFFNASYVTAADLDAAEARVRDEEREDFAHYLATQWQPWEAVMSRVASEAYGAMQEELAEAMDKEFQGRLRRRVDEVGLTGDADAERELGRQVRDELAREIKGRLMRQVLRNKGLEHLLDPPA